MKRYLIPLACILPIALSSCGGNLTPIAAVAPALIPADQLAKVRAVCATAAPALNVASAPNLPQVVSETAIDAAAFCNVILAGQVPPTADSNSAAWLDRIVAVLPTVAKAAGVILPMLL